ncbi:Group XV phospholipase A2 [Varanus komodoensis]|nr:Group XV phospholipase A2 [Varanus komodoensis]
MSRIWRFLPPFTFCLIYNFCSWTIYDKSGTLTRRAFNATGDNNRISVISSLKIRGQQRSAVSTNWLLPYNYTWSPDKIFVSTSTANYTLRDYRKFYTDIGFEDGWLMREETEALVYEMAPPGVRIHCLFGTGVDTPDSFFYDAFPDKEPKTFYGDGDGTVNLQSALQCKKWVGQQEQEVLLYELPGSEHIDMLYNPLTISYVKKLAVTGIVGMPFLLAKAGAWSSIDFSQTHLSWSGLLTAFCLEHRDASHAAAVPTASVLERVELGLRCWGRHKLTAPFRANGLRCLHTLLLVTQIQRKDPQEEHPLQSSFQKLLLAEVDYMTELSEENPSVETSEAVATTEEQVIQMQKDLDRLRKWAGDNRMAFNADKCKVLPLGHRNRCQRYRMGDKWLESSTCEQELVGSRLNMSRQCDVMAEKALSR